jgi:hypothetical protein
VLVGAEPYNSRATHKTGTHAAIYPSYRALVYNPELPGATVGYVHAW